MASRPVSSRQDPHPWTTSRLYGRRDAGNLPVRDRYGKHKQNRLLHRHIGKARLSERKGTSLFPSCLPQETAVSVLHHSVEGNGVWRTERLTGVHRDTVPRPARPAGVHAKDDHDEPAALPPRGPWPHT